MEDNPNDVEENKLYAAVGYLLILCLVPLLLRKNSQFAQFHGKQGLVLMIAVVLLWFADFLLALLGPIGWLLMVVAWITLAVFCIMGITRALAGRYWSMPFLGKYAEEIKL